MSDYSSDHQPPQPSGWSHRTFATDFQVLQAIQQLGDDRDSKHSSAATMWTTHKYCILPPLADLLCVIQTHIIQRPL